LKKYIIDATAQHGYQIKPDRFDTFLGVIMYFQYSTKDYLKEIIGLQIPY